MSTFFIVVLKMSLEASAFILLVILLRMLLSKCPKKYSYLLWSIVGFKALCPVGITLPHVLHLPPKLEYFISANPESLRSASVDTVSVNMINQGSETFTQTNTSVFTVLDVLVIIWLSGLITFITAGVISRIRLNLQLKGARHICKNIYFSPNVTTPFVSGILRTKIYIPEGLDDEKTPIILAHERCHIKRGDHIFKLIAFFILCIHWFNPLFHIAFRLFDKDLEMSCDERVIDSCKTDVDRKKYSLTLLSLAVGGRLGTPFSLGFGESFVKSRIKNVLKEKKKSKIVTFTCTTTLLGLAIAAALKPAPVSGLEAFTESFCENESQISISPVFEYEAGEQKSIFSFDIPPSLEKEVNIECDGDYNRGFTISFEKSGTPVFYLMLIPQNEEFNVTFKERPMIETDSVKVTELTPGRICRVYVPDRGTFELLVYYPADQSLGEDFENAQYKILKDENISEEIAEIIKSIKFENGMLVY